MKNLIIYNTDNGDILISSTLYDENVSVNGGLLIDIPEGKNLIRMDVSDPENHIPVFDDMEPNEIDTIKDEIKNLGAMFSKFSEIQSEQDAVLEYLLGIEEAFDDEF